VLAHHDFVKPFFRCDLLAQTKWLVNGLIKDLPERPMAAAP